MYLPRELEKKLALWMKKEHILIIKGPRQAGKTTLLKHLQEIYGGTYVNLDIPANRTLLETNSLTFSEYEQPLYFDEIANVKNAGKALKILYDETKMKIVVTGSGAFEMKENIGGALVGRAVCFELLPLSFKEFLTWKYPEMARLHEIYSKQVHDFIRTGKVPDEPPTEKMPLAEYQQWGGYPRVVLERENKLELLASLVETALEKDVFAFFDIREKTAFQRILMLLAAKNGGQLKLNSLGTSYQTAEKYVNILVQEYFIDLVFPFYKNLVTELRKTPKVYFHDLGVLSLLSDFRVSRGQIVENFAFIQLRRQYGEIKYWRTQSKAEVDFVLPQFMTPIEVKAFDEKKIGKSLLSFIKTYKPEKALILTAGFYDVKHVGETVVVFYPIQWI